MEIAQMVEKKFYTREFYKYIGQDALQSANVIVPLILKLISCEKVVDVGCGNGAWLKIFKDQGVKTILGIGGDYVSETTLLIPKEEFISLDLKEPVEIHEKFDLVLSLEVAEHLPSNCAEKFVNSLTKLGPVVLFSAAIPYQGGANHVNEQWSEYWVNLFEDNDYVPVDCIREKIWGNSSVAYWYKQNLIVFVDRLYLETNEKLKQEFTKSHLSFGPIVHPDAYIDAKNKLAEVECALQSIRDLETASLKKTMKFALKLAKLRLARLPKKAVYTVNKTISNLVSSLEQSVRSLILRCNVKHIYGPQKIDYQKNELIVTCLVRNGEIYIKSFIEHYFALGIKHLVFLDNGSTDKTVEIAKGYDNITILQTSCPYSKYETLMKKYLVNRFSTNRWNLFVDIDEFFDYPFSAHSDLSNLLNYLNKNSYTAVVSQMLDMFSDKSLSELDDKENNDVKSSYPYYDVSQIRSSKYQWSASENEKIKMHVGGIRKLLFDTDNGLTKAALVFVDKKVELFVDFHHVKNANIADFTCVLLHYPFTSHFYDKVMEAVETDRYALSASCEYKKYWDKIQVDKDFTITQSTSCKLNNLVELIDKEFLIISNKYIQSITEIKAFSEKN